LSVILAVGNVLPIPALDGGHILFVLYEIVTRRKPSQKFLIRAQVAGMMFLLFLMLYSNLNDAFRYLFN
jgi:regulator of sigma E protease